MPINFLGEQSSHFLSCFNRRVVKCLKAAFYRYGQQKSYNHPLGRPPQEENDGHAEDKKRAIGERNEVEGTVGTFKRVSNIEHFSQNALPNIFRMKIIEQHLAGKHRQSDCEDGIVVTADYVAVIDGSTSKSPVRINPHTTNGRACMLAVADFIARLAPDDTVGQFCEQVTAHIHALYPADDSRPRLHPEERLCASAVVYSRLRHEIWMVGDCQCMVDGLLYQNGKPCEELLARRRADAFGQALKDHPDMVRNGQLAHDYARDTILPALVESMAEENVTYAVIDGFPVYMPGVKVVRPYHSCAEIVLASDGYPFLHPTLQASEAALMTQLASDPYCVRTFVATKGLMEGNVSFDDRAYVRFRP